MIEKLEALCKEWQTLLRLRDWNVSIRFVRLRDVEYDGYYFGEVDILEEEREANISILDVVDWEKEVSERKLEEVLVHELVHIMLFPFGNEDNTLKELVLEQTLNTLSELLVDIRRKLWKK